MLYFHAMSRSLCIICVIHKPAALPVANYLRPVQVGKAFNAWDSGFDTDNSGDNISHLNPVVNEVTALYWFWKNSVYSKYDMVGLCHYRRFFMKRKCWSKKGLFEMSLPDFESKEGRTDLAAYASKLLEQYDIITAKPSKAVTREGKPISIKEQFGHYHEASDWEVLKNVIQDIYPDQLNSFLQFEQENRFNQLNMFMARKEFLDEYMNWLMPLMFALVERLPARTDPYQKRAAGFISERLFSFYLFHKKLNTYWLPVAFIRD